MLCLQCGNIFIRLLCLTKNTRIGHPRSGLWMLYGQLRATPTENTIRSQQLFVEAMQRAVLVVRVPHSRNRMGRKKSLAMLWRQWDSAPLKFSAFARSKESLKWVSLLVKLFFQAQMLFAPWQIHCSQQWQICGKHYGVLGHIQSDGNLRRSQGGKEE